jgi:PPOX class probable F420-dependent enzyme
VTAAAAELARERYVSLATLRRTGAEVRTPIWFAMIGERLVMVTRSDSGKVKRLRNNPRVRVAPCDARGSVHGSWHDGSARILTDPREIAEAGARLRAKYGWQVWVLDVVARLTGRIRRRAWLEVALG